MASLDRADICNAIESLFESDATLFGPTALINYITDKTVDYDRARVSIDKPYKMFLKAPKREKSDVRMGCNVDYVITVEYRIEGLRADPQVAMDKIDDIDDRIEHLCDNEMWTGLNLSGHFSNAECQVTNLEWEGSTADTRKDDGGWKVESEGTIRVEINRVKQ